MDPQNATMHDDFEGGGKVYGKVWAKWAQKQLTDLHKHQDVPGCFIISVYIVM